MVSKCFPFSKDVTFASYVGILASSITLAKNELSIYYIWRNKPSVLKMVIRGGQILISKRWAHLANENFQK